MNRGYPSALLRAGCQRPAKGFRGYNTRTALTERGYSENGNGARLDTLVGLGSSPATARKLYHYPLREQVDLKVLMWYTGITAFESHVSGGYPSARAKRVAGCLMAGQ
jgi:hypothetical protein